MARKLQKRPAATENPNLIRRFLACQSGGAKADIVMLICTGFFVMLIVLAMFGTNLVDVVDYAGTTIGNFFAML